MTYETAWRRFCGVCHTSAVLPREVRSPVKIDESYGCNRTLYALLSEQTRGRIPPQCESTGRVESRSLRTQIPADFITCFKKRM